ncbi:hypothetical protein BH10PLA2_BH10PLA2_03850 [soil metagenome]
MHLALVVLCFPCADLPLAPKPVRATYPQLVATSYTDLKQVPTDGRRPAAEYPFVEPVKLPKGARVLSAARAASGAIWVVTDQGAFRSAGGPFVALEVTRALGSHQTPVANGTHIRAVASDKDGHVWIATNNGLYCTDGAQWWQRLERRDGVPFETMTCLCLAANGDVWGGTPEGAWRLREGHFRYFWGKRWLPGNKVSSIWTDATGGVWIETDAGVAYIQEKQMSLHEKYDHFDRIVQKRHYRRGFISEIELKSPGDPSGGFTFKVSDNDGEWGSLQVALLCYRYAVTKDPAARQQAQQAMHALLELERLTGIPGYPARAVVTDAELKNGILGVDLKDKVRVPGEKDLIWFRSPVDPKTWCKGDTSSDEMDGHYFAWLLYHDLVADADEKLRIAAVVRRVTDHIMAGGFTLIGHTGRKTRWGIWAPELLNNDPFYAEQRPLNSLELLAYLKVAEHITGDSKYARAYEVLIAKHHYLINTLATRRGEQGAWFNVNHADDEMIMRCYYMLYLLEPASGRRRILAQGVARAWEPSPSEQTLKHEHNPLFNFIYGVITGRSCGTDEAVQTLQDWPWDLVQWTVQNRQRHDVAFKNGLGQNKRNELTRVLSSAERPVMRLDGNPWEADGGTDGKVEDDGVAFGLGYWFGVYHGFIGRER